MCSPFSDGFTLGLLFGAEVRDAAGVRVVGCGERFLDHLGGLVDAALDGGVDDGLAGEALLAADVHVHREDHGVGGGNDCGVQRLGAGGTLGLNLQVHAHFLGGGDQRVGGHVGVGDAGGARGHGHKAPRSRRTSGRGGSRGGRGRRRISSSSSRRSGRRVGCRLVRQCAVHQFHDLLAGGCIPQRCREVLFDQGPGQLGQQLQVLLVRAVGGGDEEDQVRRAVLGAEVHLGVEAGHGQRGNGDRRGAAVRDGDAAGDAGSRLLLAGEGVGEEAFNF